MYSHLRRVALMAGFTAGLGVLPFCSLPSATAQTPATPTSKITTFYDRYMVAGYEATNRRDHQTALTYFKRALDERPDDTYAIQAIRNVEGYLGKAAPPSVTVPTTPQAPPPPTAKPATTNPTPKPAATTDSKPTSTATKPTSTATKPTPTKPTQSTATPPKAALPKPTTGKLAPPKAPPAAQTAAPSVKPPAAVVLVPAAPTSDAFNEQQAIALINRWLQAKTDVFAPPYDLQQVVDLTTGELLASLIRPNGVLDWLKLNRAYFSYGVQKVDSVERFVVARDRATMEINLTEDRTLYLNGAIDPNRTDFSSQKVRFTFSLDNGTWKIADYKTVNGLLLERAILSPTSSAVQ
ncbi:MAG: IMS domain-containing protein [Leptolyngbyaceae cyanobacterium bins.302]|nr:IMS domain-containing protein [Leptolyngbyaceae cyanobacterium bins.302]